MYFMYFLCSLQNVIIVLFFNFFVNNKALKQGKNEWILKVIFQLLR